MDIFEDNEKEGAGILKDAIKTAISKKSSALRFLQRMVKQEQFRIKTQAVHLQQSFQNQSN